MSTSRSRTSRSRDQGNPPRQPARFVVTTYQAAEEFARGDPFVLNGAVRAWHIRAWNKVLAGP